MDDFADRHPVAYILTVIFSVILVLFVIAAFIMGLRTNFSYWWGQQQATQDKNSAGNFEAAQRQFLQDKNDVDGYVQKITAARQQLADFDKAHPSLASEDGLAGLTDAQQRQSLATNLTGLQQQCVNVVNDYNTNARAYLTADWRDANLPERLDPNSCS